MFDNWAKYVVEAADLLDLYHLEDGQEVSEQVVEVIKGNALWEEWFATVMVAIELKKLDALSPRHTHISGNGILEDLRYFKDDQ